MVIRTGGPVAWGGIRERRTVSGSSCESEIYATNEGTKTALSLYNLLADLGSHDCDQPIPVYNNNRGCVDWCKGCTVSRKLRHMNLREMFVREAQRQGFITVLHIDGTSNVADILTKEMKDSTHYLQLVEAVTSLRLLAA